MRAAMRSAHTPRGQGASPRASPRAAAGARELPDGPHGGAVGTEAAPWEYRLAFYAPTPFAAVSASVAGVDAPVLTQDGEVVRLTFALPAEAQDQVVAWQIAFE